jgi:putative membrane protein insertion efficiency factor
MPASPPLKPNSATRLIDVFAGGPCRPVADRSLRHGSPSVAVALAILRAYKLILSPLFTGSCRFVPSCADYAAEAIDTYGVGRGAWLALKRLGRCHPFCQDGHDPVPPQK